MSALKTDEAEYRTELDSHADTCVVGANVLVTHDYERPVTVTGYDASQGNKRYRTVSAAIAYDDPILGRPVIVHIHQATHIPHLQHNLLCPMQLRMNDVEVNETPKFLVKHPTDKDHAIVISEKTNDGTSNQLLIPLSLSGVTSYFPSRKPTQGEYERAEVDGYCYDLTAPTLEWNPSCQSFQDQEEERTDHRGLVPDQLVNIPPMQVCSIEADIQSYVHDNVTSSMPFEEGPIEGGLFSTAAIHTQKTFPIEPEVLSKRWGIGVQTARQTLLRTTQRGVRTVLNPTLSRRFRTNDRQLRYRRLPTTLFGDTLIASKASRRGNTCAEVFANATGWKRAYPMRKKGQAHEALSKLFAEEGVPAKIVVDGSKEQTLGEFRKKARQADCYILTAEPYTPQSNAAESAIRELKKGVGRKMVKSKAPRRLWDDCLELEAHIQSLTSSDHFLLQGEVPDTMIKGETSDISQFCQHAWYEWIKFRDTALSFPEPKMVLGRYLGPSIDIGPAMTAKILKANGQVVYRSTYRALTEEEWVSEDEKKERQTFDESVETKLGPKMNWEDLPSEDSETPIYERYAIRALCLFLR